VLGWDEAFMGVDVSDPELRARDLAADVKAATDLDCSVGIGENKLQAKIATGFGKPAGVFRITNETWYDVLGDRPPDAIWGIGAKTVAKLAALGIRTVRELAAADPGRLAKEFGPTTGPWLVLLGRGRGERDVDSTPYVPRSHGREVTFQQNIADWTRVRAEVTVLARQVSSEIAERPVGHVVVKVRYAPFVTVTHGVPFEGPVNADAFETAALAALARFDPGKPVRLLGVRAEFSDSPELRGWADGPDGRPWAGTDEGGRSVAAPAPRPGASPRDAVTAPRHVTALRHYNRATRHRAARGSFPDISDKTPRKHRPCGAVGLITDGPTGAGGGRQPYRGRLMRISGRDGSEGKGWLSPVGVKPQRS
ncbi:MAG: hypothetical protein ACRDN0_18295, partial [Trebonia sp.]